MARQLEAINDEVKFVGLYDTPSVNDLSLRKFDNINWPYNLIEELNAKISYFIAVREEENDRVISGKKRRNIDFYRIDATHTSMFEDYEA